MADLTAANLDVNTPITMDRMDPSKEAIATPYFEDYLFKIFTDLESINDQLGGALTNLSNLGAGEGVFAQLNGTVAELKSFIGGAGITISADADEITIEATAGSTIAPGTEASTITVWDNAALEWVELPEVKISWAAGVLTLTLEDGVGIDVTGLTIDGDGQLGLYFDNTEVAQTRAAGTGGLFVNNLATGSGFERALTTADLGAAGTLPTPTVANSILRSNGTNAWLELAEATMAWAAGVLTVQVEDGVGTLVDGLVIDGDADTRLFYDDVEAIATAAIGAEVYDPGAAGAPSLRLLSGPGGTLYADLHRTPGSTAIDLTAAVASEVLRLRATDAGAAEVDGVTIDPNGSQSGMHAGVSAYQTIASGLQVNPSSGAAAAQVVAIDADAESLTLEKLTTGGANLRNDENGAEIALEADDAGGTTQQGVRFDGDLGVAFNGSAPVAPQTYTPTNVTTDRSYDADTTTLDEIADVLGTLIGDLQSVGLLA